jgi:hypothetical protein
MAAAIPIIEAILAVASTTYGIVNTEDQNKKAAAAAAAAANNQKLDQAQSANQTIDAQVQGSTADQVSQADQIKAKIAAENQAAPGMSQSFYTADAGGANPSTAGAGASPQFSGIIDSIANQGQNQQPESVG